MRQRTTPTNSPTTARRRIAGAAPTLLASVVVGAGLGGCAADSYLNPSIAGRWEATPTTVPILDRIAAIEDDTGEYVEYSEITSDDLMPQLEEYRIVAGDALQIFVYDLLVDREGEILPRIVDASGRVEIPQLGRIEVAGLTEDEAKAAIEDAMRALVGNPLASVVVTERRQQTFNIFGAVPAPGQYFVPASDYRLLNALTAAGGLPQGVEEIYVIRQVNLVDMDDPAGLDAGAPGGRGTPGDGGSDDELIDLIRELTDPDAGAVGLSVIGVDGRTRSVRQPGDDQTNRPAGQPAGRPEWERANAPAPIIDLPGDDGAASPTPRASGASDSVAGSAPGRWVFLDGRWMQVARGADTPDGADASAIDDGLGDAPVVTQRVIRVPASPLAAGDASVNIVIRPGDIIRVPLSPVGRVYVEGQVVRPGVYNLPQTSKLSLTRAITAAGGLGGLAIPERVDLTRMVGQDRQATIMLNLRAIKEGTHPDVYLKPDDVINVGTNFWATPLAVVRGGLRSTYGVGFLMDRNFGNDVFGAPPTNIR